MKTLFASAIVALVTAASLSGAESPLQSVDSTQTPKGLSGSDWSGIRGAYEKNRHAIVANSDGSHQARKGARGELSLSDPATAAANVWMKRKEEARESSFQGASKALSCFFAMAPVPASFAEAVLAKKMLDQAIDPELGNEAGKGDVNLAVLTAVGFTPRIQE